MAHAGEGPDHVGLGRPVLSLVGSSARPPPSTCATRSATPGSTATPPPSSTATTAPADRAGVRCAPPVSLLRASPALVGWRVRGDREARQAQAPGEARADRRRAAGPDHLRE